jgi:uncharacterized protein YhaN
LTTRSAVAAADVKLSACRAELGARKARLAEDVAVSPDDRRAAQIASFAQAALDAARIEAEAKQTAAALRAAVPSTEQKALLAARIKRQADAIASRESELTEVQIDIATLRARVATLGGEGLGERAAELEDELAIAERDRQRIESRLEALRLLRNTIDECRTAARDAYLAPVKRSMQPFLHALFPGAEAQFDETFAVESLRREGPEAEPFDYLSHGTREQIAVMVRLALGGLLAARGQPAPVLLDDALVFSDDDRIEGMFGVLSRAAEKHQVIVLTCRTQAFRTLGGRRLTIEPQEAT